MSIYGSDIMFTNGELQVVSNGELELVHSIDTVVQDIILRLSTYYGTLFYDPTYGSYLIDFVYDEHSAETNFTICDEIIRRVESDPRVATGSVSASISSWNQQAISVSISFGVIYEDNIYNFVMSLDKMSKEFTYDYAT